MSDITSINAVLVFNSKALPQPLVLQDFWTDDIASFDEVENVETQIGADGKLNVAMVQVVHSGQVKFSPASESLAEIRSILESQRAKKRVVMGNLTVLIPNLGQSYLLEDFHFTSASIPPGLAKTVKEVGVKFKSQLPLSKQTPDIANKSIEDLINVFSSIKNVSDMASKISGLFK